MNRNTNNKEITELVQNITLNTFNVASDTVNYKILKMLPSDINTIMAEIKINKANTNRRINELLAAGLVIRKMGTGKVELSDMAIRILELFDIIKEKVRVGIDRVVEIGELYRSSQ